MLIDDSSKLALIDTHAHLDSSDYNEDRAVVIARTFAEKIGVITVGVDLESSEAALKLSQQHRFIWAGVGIHPHEARTFDAQVAKRLRELATDPKVVAIGEIGLDYYRDLSPRSTQRDVFAEQIELANDLRLPVIIHNRESTKDMLAILRKHRPKRGVIHSFLGDIDLAQEFMDLNLYLGIGGPLTFKKNDILRNAVSQIPVDRILLETDSPYLTPVPYRGKRNEPIYVRYVAEEIARLKGISPEQVAVITTQNAQLLFGI
ncbi:MAG: TatD family hydrolase [Candidatus Bipolaricaulota bacterium]|nr:TatD family hydrolase [Candidatus Bipolaricaulota bacterium]